MMDIGPLLTELLVVHVLFLTLTDLDECVTGANTCSEFANCINSDGGYTCRCFSGYSGDGYYCGMDTQLPIISLGL